MARDPDFDRISKKAHALWEAEGRPHGRDQDHWDQAREMVAIEDSQGDTLLPRDTGASEPTEDADEALRNQGEFPNLTDQGENLLTSTDREPAITATPSSRKGRMPKAEVPTSDQPGMSTKPKRTAPKSDKAASNGKTAGMKAPPPAMPIPAPADVAAQPKTASVPAAAKPETVNTSPAPKKPAASSPMKKKPV